MTGQVVGLPAVDSSVVSRVFGGILIAIFVLYIDSVAYLISKGCLTAPESDSNNDSDSEINDDTVHNDAESNDPSFSNRSSSLCLEPQARIAYHVAVLLPGFLAILLSSFVLSNASSSIVEGSDISQVLFGVVFLSFAMTLP
ncbi:hypothetical protein E4T44_08257 [Aureobasidium sp. EXF-8845]|nr:hypothetical protein E4T44_08257 [Aureobasidium sp. EXF-8845]